MNISDLTENLVDQLVKNGKLTQDELDYIIVNNPTPILKATTALVHSLFCQAIHNKECSYYDEESLEVSSVREAWTRFTIELSGALEAKDLNELRDAYVFITQMSTKIETERKHSPASIKLFKLWYSMNQTNESLPSIPSCPVGPVMIAR